VVPKLGAAAPKSAPCVSQGCHKVLKSGLLLTNKSQHQWFVGLCAFYFKQTIQFLKS